MKRVNRLLAIPMIGLLCSGAAPSLYAEDSPVVSVRILREGGGRVDWSATNNLIAFDRLGEDGYYDIYTMNPDGSNEQCLTCDKEGLVPQRHNGNPAWHPSGEYLVFQSERDQHSGLSSEATPGFGRHNDLWLARADGSTFYQLTGLDDPPLGTLHAHFSPNGRQLSWSEMYAQGNPLKQEEFFGFWTLNLGDFALGPDGATVSNIRTFEPGGKAFYENHGFSPNNRHVLFTSNFVPGGPFEIISNDVYVWEPGGTSTPQLLASEKYNEHARWSPNGRKVLWMTSAENPQGGTDYWVMNADGTAKQRLTNFNDPTNPINRGRRLTAADCAWGPDGSRIVCYVQTDLVSQLGMIVLLELTPEFAAAAAN